MRGASQTDSLTEFFPFTLPDHSIYQILLPYTLHKALGEARVSMTKLELLLPHSLSTDTQPKLGGFSTSPGDRRPEISGRNRRCRSECPEAHIWVARGVIVFEFACSHYATTAIRFGELRLPQSSLHRSELFDADVAWSRATKTVPRLVFICEWGSVQSFEVAFPGGYRIERLLAHCLHQHG